jgi:peptide/nickel transport system ATP-binding protein
MSKLEFIHVTKQYRVRGHGQLLALNDVSFNISSGRTVALVGQSGSGKSTIAKIIIGLERATTGQVLLDGVPIPTGGRALREYRQKVRMVFQDPFASLNPTQTIRHHVERPLLLNKLVPKDEVDAETRRLLNLVQLDADLIIDRRPHELSGGQRQRVAIARAIASRPALLVADEPVSMLDVSIRLGVLNLFAELQRSQNFGVLYITHDLATARHFSDEIMVLHHGQCVEYGVSDDVILSPQHEYTQSLLGASPNPERHFGAPSGGGLAALHKARGLAGVDLPLGPDAGFGIDTGFDPTYVDNGLDAGLSPDFVNDFAEPSLGDNELNLAGPVRVGDGFADGETYLDGEGIVDDGEDMGEAVGYQEEHEHDPEYDRGVHGLAGGVL